MPRVVFGVKGSGFLLAAEDGRGFVLDWPNMETAQVAGLDCRSCGAGCDTAPRIGFSEPLNPPTVASRQVGHRVAAEVVTVTRMNAIPSPDIVLQVQDLNFAYTDAPTLFDGWSASIPVGVTWAYGDTGSGKSTLMRLLGGEQPAAGRRVLDGVVLAEDPQAYRRRVFLCDRASGDYDAVNGRECTRALCAGDSGFDAALWESLLDGFGLLPHVDKPVFMLSTGSKRKLWLAAALAAGRPLTLLDEPTAALDMPSVRCLWAALPQVAHSGRRAVVVASADPLAPVRLAASISLHSA